MTDTDNQPASVSDSVASGLLPLAGRQAELERVNGLLQQAQARQGSWLGVTCESGHGKTRFAQEIAARAREMGMTRLFISCRGSLHRPYHPFAEIVRELFAIKVMMPPHQQYQRLEKALDDMRLGALLEALSGLLGVTPLDESGQKIGSGPLAAPPDNQISTDETVSGANIKLNPVDALVMLLGQVAEHEHGLCLILDDLDEAHPRTTATALELIGKFGLLSGLAVVTFASTAPQNITGYFTDDRLISLGKLDRAGSDALTRSVLHVERVSQPLLERVWGAAVGAPLFTRLLVEELQLRGQITMARTEAQLGEGRMPTTLLELLVDAASRLTDSERESLLCAAALGDGFRTGALSALRGNARSEDLQNDLVGLESKGWLERTGEGKLASFSFTNRIRQSVMHDSIPDERAKTLHNHAGDYYSVAIGGRKVRAENAAYHYMKAGNSKRAVPALEIAAQRAMSVGDHEHAQALYQLGAQAAQLEPGMSDKQIEMAERLGDMHLINGDYEKAVEAYTENSPTMTSPSLFAKLGLALLAVDPARSANILSRALAILQIGEREDLRWMLEASLSWAMALAGNSYEAIRRSRDALGRLGDTVGFGWARSMMRGMLGMVLFYDGEVQEALPHLESAKAGWGARGQQEGVILMNQVLISLPKQDVTRLWLKMILPVIMNGK